MAVEDFLVLEVVVDSLTSTHMEMDKLLTEMVVEVLHSLLIMVMVVVEEVPLTAN